ncbi:MAG: haloacid dehalogenase-like hydrolase [Actinobacteria bacterium]|nr:haloacid dehalogenase-like hydrolase [Actinomycetota bacterium]
MTEHHDDPLPSWAPGATRDTLLSFLDAAMDLAPTDRVAVFDNDGTLWTEKPLYPQLGFFLHELGLAVSTDPSLADRVEYAALIRRDDAAVSELGLPRVGMALADLFTGMSPDEFTERARRFIHESRHPTLGHPYAMGTYRPMLELLDALRTRGFANFIVTGGGTEFVRAVSQHLYGVPPEGVVGTLIGYEYVTVDGAPSLVRTNQLTGDANEGHAKVVNIQQHLGRRPVLAAGNSAGDREMIEWAVATDGPSLGILIDHDDADREVAYESVAGTFETTENIVEVGRRQGWTVVSMRDDWTQVFA